MEHTVKAFDTDLAALADQVKQLGGLAVAESADAITALLERNAVIAQDVVARDAKLDDLQVEIEEAAMRLVALRQPVADDLRRALAAMKMAANLERCGDLAKNIAKRAILLSETELPAALMRPIDRLGQLVLRRLETVLGAYDRNDLIAAREVWSRDREVDEAYESLFRELLTYMMGDARLITACSHLLFVAKNLERIGDHATNIAEVIHYAATGDQLTARPKLESLQA